MGLAEPTSSPRAGTGTACRHGEAPRPAGVQKVARAAVTDSGDPDRGRGLPDLGRVRHRATRAMVSITDGEEPAGRDVPWLSRLQPNRTSEPPRSADARSTSCS